MTNIKLTIIWEKSNMLTFFPTLYPGELIYSWLARYHYFSCNLSFKVTMKELFNNPSHISTPDLPTNLSILLKNIEHFSPSPVAEWVENHTLYRYFTFFTSKNIKERTKKSMINTGARNNLHSLTGIMASSIKELDYFRYCPHCVENNIAMYGVPYLHTVHQLQSSYFCVAHKTLLFKTSISFRGNNRNEYKFFTRKDCTEIQVIQTEDKKIHKLLLIISEESQKLIQKNIRIDYDELQLKYLYLLKENGYLTQQGRVRQDKLFSNFRTFYSPEFLDLLQSQIDFHNESCWLKMITRKHRKSFHPIRHILLIIFLGETLESFSNKTAIHSSNPFGHGPFPCLNCAAEHFKREIIENVAITYDSKTKEVIGTFVCECGFIYTRRGSENNRFKISRIKQFGETWISNLKVLINMKCYSYREIAKILNVDTHTVIKYSKESSKDKLIIPQNTIINAYREQWLELQNNNTFLTKSQLRGLDPKTYIWLYRNDFNWLKINSPKINVNKKTISSKVDWTKRDEEILSDVIQAVILLLSSFKPKRITKRAIGVLINRCSLLEQNLNKLPKTNYFLSDIVETVEDFQKRRIIWVALTLKKNCDSIKPWKIKRVAGLKSNLSADLEIFINRVINTISY